jgi:hypothetical protein
LNKEVEHFTTKI